MLNEKDMRSIYGDTEAAEKLTESTVPPLHPFPKPRRGYFGQIS